MDNLNLRLQQIESEIADIVIKDSLIKKRMNESSTNKERIECCFDLSDLMKDLEQLESERYYLLRGIQDEMVKIIEI